MTNTRTIIVRVRPNEASLLAQGIAEVIESGGDFTITDDDFNQTKLVFEHSVTARPLTPRGKENESWDSLPTDEEARAAGFTDAREIAELRHQRIHGWKRAEDVLRPEEFTR